jgi:hypothetical protein
MYVSSALDSLFAAYLESPMCLGRLSCRKRLQLLVRHHPVKAHFTKVLFTNVLFHGLP